MLHQVRDFTAIHVSIAFILLETDDDMESHQPGKPLQSKFDGPPLLCLFELVCENVGFSRDDEAQVEKRRLNESQECESSDPRPALGRQMPRLQNSVHADNKRLQ